MPAMPGIGDAVGAVLAGPLRLDAGAGAAIPAGCGAHATGKIATTMANAESVNLGYIARSFVLCAAQSAMP